jgi:hypothetical protein
MEERGLARADRFSLPASAESAEPMGGGTGRGVSTPFRGLKSGPAFILTQNWLLPANRTRLELDFETLILFKISDRNSNVRFHKSMLATGRQNSPVHDPAHSQLFNISWAE